MIGTLIWLFIALVILGFAKYLVDTFVPMSPEFKRAADVVAKVALVILLFAVALYLLLWVLALFNVAPQRPAWL